MYQWCGANRLLYDIVWLPWHHYTHDWRQWSVFDTDCESLAVRLVSLATMFCIRGLDQHVIITRLMPRFGIPRCLLDRIQGNTMREKKDTYLSMYSAKIDLINMKLKHSAEAFERISFWNHNGESDSDRACLRAKVSRNGIHLSASGRYQLYKSLRGALTSTANSLRQRLGAQAASTSGNTRSQ